MAKIYTKETWVDEVLADDPRYDIKEDGGAAFKEDMDIVVATTVTTPGTAIDAAALQNIEDQVDADDTLLRAVATEKTVSGGVLTVDQSRHTVQPQAGTADDIDTIDDIEEDTICILMASDPGTDILTFKHGADNISCLGGEDLELSEGAVICYYDGTTVFISGGGAPAYPAGFLFGLTLSNGTDTVNDIDIAAGKSRDSTDAENMILTAGITKRIDAAWAVGTGNGGIDTGSVGNNTYHMWLIKRSDTGVVDVLFSLSASAPTMPSNYDFKRRIGSIVRAGATILGFVQDGDVFTYKAPVADVEATNPGTNAVTETLTLPTGIRVQAIIFLMGFATAQADNPGVIYVSDLSLTDIGAVYNVAATLNAYSATIPVQIGSIVQYVFTNTSAQIRSRLQISGATTVIVINTNGWIDARDRL